MPSSLLARPNLPPGSYGCRRAEERSAMWTSAGRCRGGAGEMQRRCRGDAAEMQHRSTRARCDAALPGVRWPRPLLTRRPKLAASTQLGGAPPGRPGARPRPSARAGTSRPARPPRPPRGSTRHRGLRRWSSPCTCHIRKVAIRRVFAGGRVLCTRGSTTNAGRSSARADSMKSTAPLRRPSRAACSRDPFSTRRCRRDSRSLGRRSSLCSPFSVHAGQPVCIHLRLHLSAPLCVARVELILARKLCAEPR